MHLKKLYLTIIVAVFCFAGSITVFAQTQPISGKVVMKKADGTTELVEVFRVDQKGASLTDKTNKKGDFTFAGVPIGGTYVLAVSGTGIGPALSQNLRAGATDLVISVSEGDGVRLTEEDVKTIMAGASTQSTEPTKDQKEAEAERAKLEAEHAAKVAKAQATNEIVFNAMDEGIKAFNAGNFDLAVAKFDEGYMANPTFPGSAPGLLNNKGASLVKRAVTNFNTMVRSKDAAEKRELRAKVNQDFEDAITAYAKSWEISKSATPEEIAKLQKFEEGKDQTMRSTQDAVNLMIRTEATSEAKKDDVIKLMHEYLSWEKDAKKKETAQVDLGLYLLRIYDYESSIVEYRKALLLNPNNADAIGGLGLSLWTISYGSEDTARKQEALNYMQLFFDTAPKDHPFREGIDGGIADLKAQKFKPQKIAAKN